MSIWILKLGTRETFLMCRITNYHLTMGGLTCEVVSPCPWEHSARISSPGGSRRTPRIGEWPDGVISDGSHPMKAEGKVGQKEFPADPGDFPVACGPSWLHS